MTPQSVAPSIAATSSFATLDHLLLALGRHDAGVRFGAPAVSAVSYAELGERVRGNALHFHRLGVRRGDRVAISLDADLEHVVTLLALVAVGAVPLSIKPRRGGDDYAAMVARLCRRFEVRFGHHLLPPVERLPRLAWDPAARSADALALGRAHPDDVAVVQFSSGSLGDPKAIPLSHHNILSNLHAILAVDGRRAQDTVYNFLPLSHDMGLIGGLLSNLLLQNPLRLTSTQSFLRNPLEGFLDGQANIVPMPNFALRYLARALQQRVARAAAGRPALPPDLFARLHSIYCGAEPIRHETIAALVAVAAPLGFAASSLIFSYGLAEATLIVAARRFTTLSASFCARSETRQLASVGRPVAGTEVRVGEVGGDGEVRPCAPDVEGGIFVRGPGVVRGYLDEAPRTPAGWFETGDLGFLHHDELYISGRSKDLLILNGENVFPADIEAVAARHPGVRECVVLADDERFYLYAIAAPGAELDHHGLAASVGSHFGSVPAAVIGGAPGTILRTSSGKPMRQAMLAALRQRSEVR